MYISMKAELMQNITNIMSAISEKGEMTAIWSSKRVTFTCMDAPKIRSGHIHVNKDVFDACELPEEEIETHISVKQMKNALQACSVTDLLTLTVSENNSRIHFEAGIVKKTLTLLSESTYHMMNVKPDCKVKIAKIYLTKAFSANKDVSTSLDISLDTEGLKIQSSNSNGEKAEVTIVKDLLEDYLLAEGLNQMEVTINLELLQQVVRAIPSSAIIMRMQTRFPLVLIFDVKDTNPKVRARITIAPIMDEKEESGKK